MNSNNYGTLISSLVLRHSATILGIVPDINLGLYLGMLSGYEFLGIFLVAILLVKTTLVVRPSSVLCIGNVNYTVTSFPGTKK